MRKKFGKIEDGVFIAAPKKIKDKNFSYFNPKEDKYLEFGYFEVIQEDYPNDGKVYEAIYEQKDTYILQSWKSMSEDEITRQEQSQNTTLEARIAFLEEQLAFLMEYGDFKKPWQEHKYKK